jgi:uncharacterized protein YbcI
MPDTRTPGGSPAQDISRKAVRILREYTGRGPTKARTVISDDTVAIVLGDTLTKGERTLVAMGEEKHVLQTRHNYQLSMRDDLVQLVEEECGQTVEAFFSDNHIDPDYGVEFFLLNPRRVENDVNSSDVHAGRTG